MTLELTLTRLIDAPRERVFDAWTNPAALQQWFGPRGFTTTTQTIDVRPGGVWQFVMHGPGGMEFPNYMTFETIDRPERITYFHGDDANQPRDLYTTVTFADEGGQTRLTMTVRFANEAQYHEALGYGAPQSGHTTIDKLAEYVAAESGPGVVVLTRLLDAPPYAVWYALTEPEQIRRWWGPAGTTSPVCRVDFRVGGRYLFSMQDENGAVSYSTGEYREIVPLQRIVFTDRFADADGNVVPAGVYGLGDAFDGEALVTLTLTDLGDERTALTLTNSGPAVPAAEHGDAIRQGWGEMFAKLGGAATALPAAAPVVIVREFDAPVAAVWRAWTEPEPFMRWWGPEHFTSPLARMDLRVGGRYLFAMRDPAGNDYYSTGIYREIEPLRRLVYTDSFADADGNVLSPAQAGMGDNFPAEMLVTVTFEDIGGRTRLTIDQGQMPLDLMYVYSKLGWSTSLDKLDAVVTG